MPTIEHVVVVVKENHTFDNYFGRFPGAQGVSLPAAADPHPDQNHDHAAWLAAVAGTGGVKMQYGSANIPATWALAQQYALCDQYFTDVGSESEPNHLFLIAGDSPVIDNSSASRTFQPSPPYDLQSLPAVLQQSGRQWRNYADTNSSYFTHIKALQGNAWNVPAGQFDTDLKSGFLPDVAWLYPPYASSDHPGGGRTVVEGDAWTRARVQALAQSSLWPHCAMIITWDDWGGWYDHVKAPERSTWLGNGPTGYHGSQFRYGYRVPCLVVSPYARKQVISRMYSHASVVKFCLRLFGLPAWAAAALQTADPSGDLWECFDFQSAPRLAVPSFVPA
jgi:phospholipase C